MANDKQTERIQNLAKKWQEGTITAEEKREFEVWYDNQDNAFELNTAESQDQTAQRILDQILQKAGLAQPETKLWPRIVTAASILLIVGFGGYFIIHQKQPQQQTAQRTDIRPGNNQATLTLANGQKIVLNTSLSGKIATQAGATITVNKGTNVIYHTIAGNSEVVYNTISTARGQQSPYPLILPDGSKVWLNAASSITFPTRFKTNERKVTVTGEAYLAVIHNSKRPFKVSVNGQTIEDIGTEFNINAYNDEPSLKTTLISGSVKITADDTKRSITLKPNQQAVNSHNQLIVQTVDTEGITAWKNNYFFFDNNTLEVIMRQVTRWYNVDIKYENEAAKAKMLTGTISRYKSVSSVLKKIELTGVARFKLDGNQIIVTN